MPIVHIVLFQFKTSASTEKINELSSRFVALEHECLSAAAKKPYILSMKGGTDNSNEGAQNGMTHGFVLEFETAADRDYYVDTDPVHQEFKSLAGEIVEKATVLDFASGVFV